jgi:hypothetical protein
VVQAGTLDSAAEVRHYQWHAGHRTGVSSGNTVSRLGKHRMQISVVNVPVSPEDSSNETMCEKVRRGLDASHEQYAYTGAVRTDQQTSVRFCYSRPDEMQKWRSRANGATDFGRRLGPGFNSSA